MCHGTHGEWGGTHSWDMLPANTSWSQGLFTGVALEMGVDLELEFPGVRFLRLPEQGTINSVTETIGVYSPHPSGDQNSKISVWAGLVPSLQRRVWFRPPSQLPTGGQQPLDCIHLTLVCPPSSHSCPFPWTIPLLTRTAGIGFKTHLDNPWLAHLQVLNQFLCICKGLISKWGHILKSWMDMNSGQDNVQSTTAVNTYIPEKQNRIDWTAPHLYVFLFTQAYSSLFPGTCLDLSSLAWPTVPPHKWVSVDTHDDLGLSPGLVN